MVVGFKMLREKFTSRVTLTPKERIDVEYLDGPFRYLENRWLFIDKDGGCEIDFFIDFEFRSRLLRGGGPGSRVHHNVEPSMSVSLRRKPSGL